MTNSLFEQYDFLKELLKELEEIEKIGKTMVDDKKVFTQINELKFTVEQKMKEIEIYVAEMGQALENELAIVEMVA